MDLDTAIELDFEKIIKETDKAWQIKFSAIIIEWIPKSQARILNNILYLAEWLVKQKELEEFKI